MNGYSAIGAGRTAYSPRNEGGGSREDGGETRDHTSRNIRSNGSHEEDQADTGAESSGSMRNEPNRHRPDFSEDDAHWIELMSGETLADDFTARLMAELEGVEIEAAGTWEHDALRRSSNAEASQNRAAADANESGNSALASRRNPQSDSDSRQDSVSAAARSRRGRAKRIWLASAALLLLAGSIVLYTQPTIAERVLSLFTTPNYIDTGMREARDEGMVTLPGSEASVTNEGYTVSVQEVIADSTRLVAGIVILDKDGNLVEGKPGSPNLFELYDSRGRIPYTLSTSSTSEVNRIVLSFARPVLDDTLQLDFQIRDIEVRPVGVQGAKTKVVRGNWPLYADIDLSKAKARSMVTKIDQTYITPGGIRIEMSGATRTPSGGSLEFKTSLTPEAQKRAKDGAAAEHHLIYHLEDAQGELLGDNLSTDSYIMNRPYDLDRWSGVNRWFTPFDNFAYDKNQIRFVLDGYVITENSSASVTFDPAELSEQHPAEFNDSGDRFRLNGIKFVAADSPDGTGEAHVSFDGTYNNPDFFTDAWMAVDEQGKSYPVSLSVGLAFENPKLQGEQFFIVKGMSELPKRLTIKRTSVQHMYRDVNWSFVIPQTGTPGVTPE